MANMNCPIGNVPERRRAARTPYDAPVRFAVASAKGAGTVKDISSEGMFMETPAPPVPGERISIDFQFRNSRHPMTIEGEVARRSDTGAGIKFIWP